MSSADKLFDSVEHVHAVVNDVPVGVIPELPYWLRVDAGEYSGIACPECDQTLHRQADNSLVCHVCEKAVQGPIKKGNVALLGSKDLPFTQNQNIGRYVLSRSRIGGRSDLAKDQSTAYHFRNVAMGMNAGKATTTGSLSGPWGKDWLQCPYCRSNRWKNADGTLECLYCDEGRHE